MSMPATQGFSVNMHGVELSRRDFLGSSAAFAVTGCVGVLPGESPVVSFGFITDCHFADIDTKPGDIRFYRESLSKLSAFVADMNATGVDFVVEGGDFKDLGATPEKSLEYLDSMEATLAKFKGPRYHVLGNHDHDNISKDEFLSHVSNHGQERAKAFYSFERGGVKFIVLDACYRPDGTPYCRGNFFWKDALIPSEQLEFLKSELASATGACVPLVHQQLDAEDETCIRNAAEVRKILEDSGKVKCVIQGHIHEGCFHEINGIGYYSSEASVLGHKSDSNAYSVIEVYPSGGVRIMGKKGASSVVSRPCGWENTVGWQPGHYQVHYIFTGRGESMLHLFPDGTSMLLDVGDSMRFYGTPQETPHLPDISRRSGEWIARYVERVNPKGRKVDYFLLSHYHEDHGGGKRWHDGRISAPTGDYWFCGLADAARFLEFGKVIDRAWPDFNDPFDALAEQPRIDGTARQVKAVYAALAAKGTQVERFRLGADDQLKQLDAAKARPGFKVFNLCACGRYVRKDGSVADPYAHLIRGGKRVLNENGMSCGMIVTYGNFNYFTAGDFSDGIADERGNKVQIENLLAEAVGPVDVAKLNHHGHHSMYPELVKALQARVWTACVLDQAHCTDDTMNRLNDQTLYRGARMYVPTYMPLRGRKREDYSAYLPLVSQAVVNEPCHVILDVPEGGDTYSLSCVSAADETMRLKARYGFLSRVNK